MSKSMNPKIPKLTFQKLVTASSMPSAKFGAISNKGLAENLGLKAGAASIQANALKFGSPATKSASGIAAESSSSSTTSNILTSYLSGVLGSSVLGSAFTGLSSLFGFGSRSSVPAAVRFALPDSQSVVAALPSNAGRATATRSLQAIGSSRSSTAPVGGHQFHFHVSAMDTQSFVDRSSDIAKAVKTAMLQSNALNDVVSEI